MLIRVLLLWMSILPLSLAQSGDASGASASGSQPVKSGAASAKPAPPLAPEQQARFEAGKDLFFISCAACHQPHGLGLEGLAPPLVESEWVLGSEQRLIRIALHGLRGPITVKGKPYQLEMPPMGVFEDEQIAAVLTYVRREWGHAATPVASAAVTKVREATAKREEPWTETELLKIP